MSPSTKNTKSPFLDVKSFQGEELETFNEQETSPIWHEPETPFDSLYQLADQENNINPEAEEYISFLAELHEPEFDEAIFELVNEAADLYETEFQYEFNGLTTQKIQTERMLKEHFAPLQRELETFLETIAEDIENQDLENMSEAEIDDIIDRFQFSQQLSPSFEYFGGWFKKKLKKAAKWAKGKVRKGVNWAKAKAKALASKAFAFALRKLRMYMKPWLNKIVSFAINKLPSKYRPLAKILAQKLGVQKELEGETVFETNEATTDDITQIQQEFDVLVTNLLLTEGEEKQELIMAEALSDSYPDTEDLLGNLDQAREQFINEILELKEGEEDLTPQLENFIPAILPLVKVGLKFYGRGKLVKFLAKYIARLIKRFVPRKYLAPLSQAIVDAGLRLINLETTPEDELRVASESIVDTVEEVVRKVAILPDYILNDEELLEGFVLEAFESAASANLPPILPDKVYQDRPELRETMGVNGTWVWQPSKGTKRFKKYTKVFEVELTPHMTRTVKTWRGIPLKTVLQNKYGLAPGKIYKAKVHLYQATPGTWLSRISKSERLSGLGTSSKTAWSKIQPLTPEASATILGHPRLGRSVSQKFLSNPLTLKVGQRFYYLEIPDSSIPVGRSTDSSCCQTHLKLDFPQNQIRIYIFLNEAKSQEIAMKFRQQMHIGAIMNLLRPIYTTGLKTAFAEGMYHQIQIIHGAISIGQNSGMALKWLPTIVQEMLVDRLVEWTGRSLYQHLGQNGGTFDMSTKNEADGVTLFLSFSNPSGFSTIRRILGGEQVALRGMKISNDMPEVKVKIVPGYWYG